MSKRKNTAEVTKPATPAPGAVPRRDSTHALWAALRAHPGSTTAALADIAGIGVSTARRLLARWEDAGHAQMQTGPAAPRTAKTWTTGVGAPADIEPDPAPTVPSDPEPADPAEPVGPVPEPAPVSAVTVPPLHSAEARAVWEALVANPASTTAELGRFARVGTISVRHLLTEWTLAGFVWSATDPDRPRAGAKWTAGVKPAPPEPESVPADPVEEPEPVAPTPDAAETAVAARTGDELATSAPEPSAVADDVETADAESTVVRLPAGALRGQVEDYLRNNPGEEFTPHQIGKALDRSSGAVHNALIKLTDSGIARQTSTAPKRFTLAS